MKTLLTTYLLLNLFFTPIVFAQNALSQDKPISIVMSGFFPPWNNTVDGEQVGFEPDMIEEMCNRMQRTCEIHTIYWKQLVSSIRFGKYDVGMSGIEIDPNMREMFITSDSYGRVGGVIIARKDSELAKQFCTGKLKPICDKPLDLTKTTPEELGYLHAITAQLRGKRIEAELNSNWEFMTKDLLQINKIQAAGTINDMFVQLKNNHADAIVLPNELWRSLSQDSKYHFAQSVGPVFYADFLGSNIAAIATEKNADIIEAMNIAIRSMKEDGTLAELSIKWFGRDITK